MKKRELERAQKSYATGLNTDALRAKVAQELQPVKNAYDVAHQAIEQIEALMGSVQHADAPTRAMRDLAAALKDAAGVLKSMRDEARDSVRFEAEAAGKVRE